MRTLTSAAPAKINLALEILGRRGDGFHQLETVFQTLEFGDRVTVSVDDHAGPISLTCSDPTLPADSGNLAWKAAEAVRLRVPDLGAIDLILEKHLPHGAGLGGGSSDAATVLRALARLDARVAALDLHEIASALGSDVPFFLIGGTAHATGRGEVLSPLPDAPASNVTVLMPRTVLPTPAVYRELTAAERGPRDARGADVWTALLATTPIATLAHNRLTAPARRLCPPLANLLDWLAANRIPHIMCGSGAACAAFAHIAPPEGIRAWRTSFRPRARLDEIA